MVAVATVLSWCGEPASSDSGVSCEVWYEFREPTRMSVADPEVKLVHVEEGNQRRTRNTTCALQELGEVCRSHIR
jgi:hypothetical protein